MLTRWFTPRSTSERSLSDSLAKVSPLLTLRLQDKVGFYENRLAQSKPDQSYVILDSEDVGRRAT